MNETSRWTYGLLNVWFPIDERAWRNMRIRRKRVSWHRFMKPTRPELTIAQDNEHTRTHYFFWRWMHLRELH